MLYVLHESIKWVSSSIIFGQNVQNLSSLIIGGLVCLPFSIAKQWSLSRSFVSVYLCLRFLFYVCFMNFVGYCFRAYTNSVIRDFSNFPLRNLFMVYFERESEWPEWSEWPIPQSPDEMNFREFFASHSRHVPGVLKKSSGALLIVDKKVLNLAISTQSSEMLDIST